MCVCAVSKLVCLIEFRYKWWVICRIFIYRDLCTVFRLQYNLLVSVPKRSVQCKQVCNVRTVSFKKLGSAQLVNTTSWNFWQKLLVIFQIHSLHHMTSMHLCGEKLKYQFGLKKPALSSKPFIFETLCFHKEDIKHVWKIGNFKTVHAFWKALHASVISQVLHRLKKTSLINFN